MTLERVCFLTNYNQYESKRHFAFDLSQALEKEGVQTEIFDARILSLENSPNSKSRNLLPISLFHLIVLHLIKRVNFYLIG